MKQILLVNDIAGYGKVGMAAMLPILSYMGIPAFCLPTALVSNTLDYGEFAQQDTTDYMRRTFPIWQHLGFHFDAICTGLIFSPEQARLVEGYCREQAAQGCTIFVDPVMGDGGRLYNGIDQRQVELMRSMVGVAGLCMPNYTEACYLCGVPCRSGSIGRDEACRLLDSLVCLGARSAIITSCTVEGLGSCVCGRCADGTYFFHDYQEIPGIFHGTGDIFAAVLIGSTLGPQAMPLPQATRRAMDVVSQMIARQADEIEDRNCGIFIERCLDLL